MKQILLLSDNHSYLDERILHHAQMADEIWHAGDIGNEKLIESLEKIKPTRGVYGNIDGTEVRKQWPEYLFFECEGMKILILHIGGYPERYSPKAKELILKLQPNIFISGHSHILKVMHDPKQKLLHMNPGACGKQGWHKKRTLLRFRIEGNEISNLEIIELGDK